MTRSRVRPAARAKLLAEKRKRPPRSPFTVRIDRGTGAVHKVRRWLRAMGLFSPLFVTQKAKDRHIHPRSKRNAQSNRAS